MKKHLSILLISMMASFWLTSCEDTEGEVEPVPSIGVVQEPGTVTAGNVATFEFTVVAEARIDVITFSLDGNPTPLLTKDSGFTQNTSDNFNYSYTTNPSEAGSTLTFTLTVTDNRGRSANRSVNVIVEPAGTPVTSYGVKLLSAPLGNSASKTFFSLANGETYTATEITTANLSANIDFGYFYGATLEASIAAPSAYPTDVFDISSSFSTLNTTQFKRSSTATFEGLNLTEELGGIFDTADGDGSPRFTGLAVGDVLIFQTAADTYGMLRVTEIVPGDGVNGSISIDVKAGL